MVSLHNFCSMKKKSLRDLLPLQRSGTKWFSLRSLSFRYLPTCIPPRIASPVCHKPLFAPCVSDTSFFVSFSSFGSLYFTLSATRRGATTMTHSHICRLHGFISCSHRWSSSVCQPSLDSNEDVMNVESTSSDCFMPSMGDNLDDYEALLLQVDEECPGDSATLSDSVASASPEDGYLSDGGKLEQEYGSEALVGSAMPTDEKSSVSSNLQVTSTLIEMIKDVLPDDGATMRLTDLSPAIDLELLEDLPSAPSSSAHSGDSSNSGGGQGISLLSFLRMHPRHFAVVQEEEVSSNGGVVKRWHVRTSLHGADGVQRSTRTSTSHSNSSSNPNRSGKGSSGSSESSSLSGGGRVEGDNLLDNLDVTSLFLEEEMKNVLKSTSCRQKKAGNACTSGDGRKEKKYNDHDVAAASQSSSASLRAPQSSHSPDATRRRHRLQSIIPPPPDPTGADEHSSLNQVGTDDSSRRRNALWSKECLMVWERVAGLLKEGEMLSVFQLRTRLQELDPELLEWFLENPSPSSSVNETSSLPGALPSAPLKTSPTGFRRLLWQHRHLAKKFLDFYAMSVEGWVSRAGELQGILATCSPVRDSRTTTEGQANNDVQNPTVHDEDTVPAEKPHDFLWTKDRSPHSWSSSSTSASQKSTALKDEEFAEDWVVELNLEEEEENVWTIGELDEGEMEDQMSGSFSKGAGSSANVSKPSSNLSPLTKKQKKQLQRERAEAERQKNSKKKKTENLPPTSSDSLASPEELLAEHTRLAEQRGWYTPAEILDLLVECVPTFPVPMDQLISSDALIKLFGVHLSMRRLVLIYRYYFLTDMERIHSPTVCLHPTLVLGVHPQAGVANAYYKHVVHPSYHTPPTVLASTPEVVAGAVTHDVPSSFSGSAFPSLVGSLVTSTTGKETHRTPLQHSQEPTTWGKDGADLSPALDVSPPVTLPTVPQVVGKEASGGTATPPMTSLAHSSASPLPNVPTVFSSAPTSQLSTKSRRSSTGAFTSLRRTIKSKVHLRDLKKKVSKNIPADGSLPSAPVIPSGMPEGSTALQSTPSIRPTTSSATATATPIFRSSTHYDSLPLSGSSSSYEESQAAREMGDAISPPHPAVPLVPSEKKTEEGGPPQGKGETTDRSDVVTSGAHTLLGVGCTGGSLAVGQDERGRISGGKSQAVPMGRDSLRENLVVEALHFLYDQDGILHQDSCDHSSACTEKDGTSGGIAKESGSFASLSSSLRDILIKLLLTVPYTHFTPLEEVASRCGTDVDTLEDLLDRSQVVQSRYAAFLLHTAAATSSNAGNDVGSRPARRRRFLRLRPLWIAPNSTGDLTGIASSSSSDTFALPPAFLRKLLPTWRPLHRIVESIPEKERKQLLSAASHSSSLGQYLSLFGRSTCWVDEQLGCGPSSKEPAETTTKRSHASSPIVSSTAAATPIRSNLIRVRRYTGDLEMDDIEPIALRALYYCCHAHEYRSLESVLQHAKKAELLARKHFGLPTTMGGRAGLVLGEGITNMLTELTLMSGEEKLSLPRRISRHPTLFEVSGSSLSSFSTPDKSLQSFLLRRRTLFTTANFMHSPHKKQ